MRSQKKMPCPHCNTKFTCDRDEDGAPEIPDTIKCAGQDCEIYLCPAGCQDISWVCSGCNGRFCLRHAGYQFNGDVFCRCCMTDVVDANRGRANEYELPEVA